MVRIMTENAAKILYSVKSTRNFFYWFSAQET